MQPPTEPVPPQPTTNQLRRDEGDLYRRHHRALLNAVCGAKDASGELVEDACQTAWARLLRRRPNCVSAPGWLYVVALHEAYRLAAIERHELPVADLSHELARDSRIPNHSLLDDQLEARDALRAVAQLPERQRRDLTLLVAGYSYREIAQMTGGRSYNNVNKHLLKARRRIRTWRSDAQGANPAASPS
jgi:RNA polymerase sigma factor (sigma-70 family)